MKKTTAFSKLTKAEQRVQIVKDTLKLISLGVANVKEGTYCIISSGVKNLTVGEQFNKNLKQVRCTVCGKGALFLGHIDRLNDCKVPEDYWDDGKVATHDFDNEETIKKRLSRHFSPLQLDMIEAAFEQDVIEDSHGKLKSKEAINSYLSDDDEVSPLGQSCIDFGKQLKKPKDRLIAILKNIIKNNGQFNPKKPA